MNEFLLDTHSFIWWQANDPRFSVRMRAVVLDPANQIFVSAVTCWEIAIKYQLGKLAVDADIAADVEAGVRSSGMTPLPIEFAHAQRAGSLPLFHKDPFDRLLIAQSLIENLTLISVDSKFDPYGVQRVW